MKSKSTFTRYLSDSLSSLEMALLVLKELEGEGPKYATYRSLEDMKVFHMARSFETLSKAFLAAYGAVIAFSSLLLVVSRRRTVSSRHVKKVLKPLATLLRQSADERKIRKRWGHDPFSKSQFPGLLGATAKLLDQVGARDLAEAFRLVKEFIEKRDKTYNELQNVRKEVLKSVNFKEDFRKILDILNECFSQGQGDVECEELKKVPPDVRSEVVELLNVYRERTYLLDQVLTMLDVGIQEIFDGVLYTSYLARATVVAFYSAGRDESDERYLEDVRDHQKEMLEYMMKVAEMVNRDLAENAELDDFITEVEDEARRTSEGLSESSARSGAQSEGSTQG